MLFPHLEHRGENRHSWRRCHGSRNGDITPKMRELREEKQDKIVSRENGEKRRKWYYVFSQNVNLSSKWWAFEKSDPFHVIYFHIMKMRNWNWTGNTGAFKSSPRIPFFLLMHLTGESWTIMAQRSPRDNHICIVDSSWYHWYPCHLKKNCLPCEQLSWEIEIIYVENKRAD